MLWYKQAIFESKGDKSSTFAECRIRTQDLRHQIAGRVNPRWQTDWAIEDQAINLNSTARPYGQRAFSLLDPTACWLPHLALVIYMFVVVNFDTLAHVLAQASDIRIERRQVVFLCWMQDSNPESPEPNLQQTECPLTNYSMEPYLYLVKKAKYRHSIAKLRCSSHMLEIERGRHTSPKTPAAERKCPICKEIDDEKHFVLECQINKSERDCFFNKLVSIYNDFMCLDANVKFNFIMTICDPQCLNWLGKFLHESFRRKYGLATSKLP